MDLDTFGKVIGIAGSILGALFFGAKVLIEKWQAAEKALNDMKAKEVFEHITSLETQLKEHKRAVAVLWGEIRTANTTIKNYQDQLAKVETQISGFLKDEAHFIDGIQEMKTVFDRRVSLVEETISEFNLVKISTDTFMLKGKRKNSE